MSYVSLLVLRAQEELLEAWEWYEDKQPGLGDRFKTELYNRIHEIEKHPERYSQRKSPYHETGMKIFPYIIIYRINKRKNFIVITSIFHASRNPKKKYRK